MIQYEHGQTPSTSLTLALDQFLPYLSNQAVALMEALSFLAPGERCPGNLPELLHDYKNVEDVDLDGIDWEAARYELIEYYTQHGNKIPL